MRAQGEFDFIARSVVFVKAHLYYLHIQPHKLGKGVVQRSCRGKHDDDHPLEDVIQLVGNFYDLLLSGRLAL